MGRCAGAIRPSRSTAAKASSPRPIDKTGQRVRLSEGLGVNAVAGVCTKRESGQLGRTELASQSRLMR